MMTSFAPMIQSLAGENAVLRRFATGTYSMGRYTPGEATDKKISAIVVRAGKQTTQRLPEGERSEDLYDIYTSAPVRAVSVQRGEDADQILVDGWTFEVERVNPWPQGAYYFSVARRVGQ